VASDRAVQIDDQTTSPGLSLSMIRGGISSSSRRSHGRAPARSGSVSAWKTAAGGAGCWRLRVPISITTDDDRPIGSTAQPEGRPADRNRSS
jgi:hypothetical protein